jgi:hypothetical protein
MTDNGAIHVGGAVPEDCARREAEAGERAESGPAEPIRGPPRVEDWGLKLEAGGRRRVAANG